MKDIRFHAAVIGGGAAGLAAAVTLHDAGHSVVLIEREEQLGGILLQCIHNGFGLQEFGEELTGPEYAFRFIRLVEKAGIAVYLNTTVMDIQAAGNDKILYCYSSDSGVMRINAESVVLAMGCRERNRGNIRIPGTRPAGIFTAGLAQRLVNIEGYIPGREVVILGSGDIGLIMARRMIWAGSAVKGIIEIQPYPSGLTRNIVQCVNDFSIPLYLNHTVSRIYGKDRIEKVDVTPIVNGIPKAEKSFQLTCDTLLISAGLVPENELSKEAGIALNPQTGGPQVDSSMMTSMPGVYACGNVLHVHDLVDYATDEARRTAGYISTGFRGRAASTEVRTKAGTNVRYVVPGKLDPSRENTVYLRTMIVKNNAEITVMLNNRIIKKEKRVHVQPSEMIDLHLDHTVFAAESVTEDAVVTIGVS